MYAHPSLQYSTVYPSSPPFPMVSGILHLRLTESSLTSTTVRFRGALVGTAHSVDTKELLLKYYERQIEGFDELVDYKAISLKKQQSASRTRTNDGIIGMDG